MSSRIHLRLFDLIGANALGGAVGWNLTNLGGAPESVSRHYGVGLETVGLLGTALFLGLLVLLVPSGRLIDRTGPVVAGRISLAVIAGSNVAVLLVPGFVPVAGLRILIGAGVAMGFVAGASYVNVLGGSVLAQGFFGGTVMGGAGVAIASVAFLEPYLGWRAPFTSAAVVAAIAFVALMFAHKCALDSAADEQVSFGQIIGDRRLWGFASAQAATFGISVVLGNWVVPFLSRYGGYSERVSGAIGGLILLGGIVGRPLGGYFASVWPRQRRLLVGISLVATGGGCLLLVAPRPLMLAIVSTAGIGLAAGLAFGPLTHGTAELRPEARGSAIAAMNVPAVVAIMLLVPLFGKSFALPGGGRLGVVVLAGLVLTSTLTLPPSSVFSLGSTDR